MPIVAPLVEQQCYYKVAAAFTRFQCYNYAIVYKHFPCSGGVDPLIFATLKAGSLFFIFLASWSIAHGSS